jgi:hypothetical protein
MEVGKAETLTLNLGGYNLGVTRTDLALANKVNKEILNSDFEHHLRKQPYNPIWTISYLYFPIVGYYDRAKFRADHFSRSGGVTIEHIKMST